MNGQAKPTPPAYNLYVKETYSKLKGQYDQKDLFSEVAKRWKTLDPKKKNDYIKAAALLKEKAILKQEQFNERHGLTPQKAQRREYVYVEQPLEEFSDHEEEEVEAEAEQVISPPKPKKRKTSVSSEQIIKPLGDYQHLTVFSYFITQIHTGNPRKAREAFDKLTKKEHKQLLAEYTNKKEKHYAQLRAYLNSLSKDDAITYVCVKNIYKN